MGANDDATKLTDNRLSPDSWDVDTEEDTNMNNKALNLYLIYAKAREWEDAILEIMRLDALTDDEYQKEIKDEFDWLYDISDWAQGTRKGAIEKEFDKMNHHAKDLKEMNVDVKKMVFFHKPMLQKYLRERKYD